MKMCRKIVAELRARFFGDKGEIPELGKEHGPELRDSARRKVRSRKEGSNKRPASLLGKWTGGKRASGKF